MPKRIIKKESVTNEEKLSDLLAYTELQGECMLWKGAVNTDGYAHMLGNIKVHRLVYQLKHDKDITGLVVRHKCDTPLCLNPGHLLIGTPADNNRDRNERGRTYKVITKDVVTKVKVLLETKVLLQTEIAEIVGIDPRRVSDIKRGAYTDDGRFIKR